MNNAELVEALRTDIREIEDDSVNTLRLMWQAADLIEAQAKRIAELEDEIKNLENAYIAELKQAHINVQRSAEIYREWYEAVGRKKNE